MFGFFVFDYQISDVELAPHHSHSEYDSYHLTIKINNFLEHQGGGVYSPVSGRITSWKLLKHNLIIKGKIKEKWGWFFSSMFNINFGSVRIGKIKHYWNL